MLSSGLDLLAVPAAFTEKTGAAHWELLVRARAVENQCYVVAANQGGSHENGRRTFGDSMVVDGWGKVLSRRAEGAGFAIASYDRAQMELIRSSFPVRKHRCLTD